MRTRKIKGFIARHTSLRTATWLMLWLMAFLTPLAWRYITNPNKASAWFNDSWSNRKQITIEADQIPGSSDLTDYPVLVKLASDAELAATAQADGDDLVFTSDNGSTQLDHEIESYTTATGALVAWVRIPTLSATSDTTIYLYYGNSGATSQEDVDGTWSSTHAGTWHLAENPSGSAPQMLNSAGNSADGTSNGTMTTADQVAATVNGGLDFEGTDDYISVPDAASFDIGNTGTLQAWVKPDAVTSAEANFSAWTASTAPTGANGDNAHFEGMDMVIVGNKRYYAALMNNNAGTLAFQTAYSDLNGANLVGADQPSPANVTTAGASSIAIDSDGVKLYYATLGYDGTALNFKTAFSDLNGGNFSGWTDQTDPAGATTTSNPNSIDLVIVGGKMYFAAYTHTSGTTITFETANINLDGSGMSAWTVQTDPSAIGSTGEAASTAIDSNGEKLYYTAYVSNGTSCDFLVTNSNLDGSSFAAWTALTDPTCSGNDEESFADMVIAGDKLYFAVYSSNDATEKFETGNSALDGSSFSGWTDRTAGMNAGSAIGDGTNPMIGTDGKSLYYGAFAYAGGNKYFDIASSTITSHPVIVKADAYELIQTAGGFVFDWAGKPITFGSALSTAAYSHVVITQDGTNLKFYVNGTLLRTQTVATDFTATATALGLGGNGVTYFDGITDEMRIHSDALSADTITTIYNNINAPATFVTLGSEEDKPVDNTPVVVAHWKFDEGAENTCNGGEDACDSTQNGIDGTNTGATRQTEAQCISGKCYSFGNDGDNLDFGNNHNFATTDTFTISAWVKPNHVGTTDQTIIAKGTSGNCFNYILSVSSTGSLLFGNTNGNTGLSSSNSMSANQWYHVSVTYNNGAIKGYINGVEQSSGSRSTSTCTQSLKIGSAMGAASQRHFDGFIDEVKISNYARTAAEIKSDFNQGAVKIGTADQGSLSNGLMGYWRMDETSGTTIADASGNGNTGTLTNAQEAGTSDASGNSTTTLIDTDSASLSATDDAYNGMILNFTAVCGSIASGTERIISDYTGATKTITVSPALATAPDNCAYEVRHQTGGKFGSGVKFDDTNDKIIITNSISMSTGSTIGSWVKFKSGITTLDTIVKLGGQQGVVGFHWLYFQSNSVRWQYANGTIQQYKSASFVPVNDRWYYVVATHDYSSKKISFYVDGILIGSATHTDDVVSATNITSTNIGSYNDTHFMNDSLDEVRIYNRALSSAEIAQLYQWTPGPVGHWRMDEGNGATTYDSSGNSSNGTITNATWQNGKIGKALRFDGNGDYVDVGNATSLQVNHVVTLEAWVRTSAATTQSVIDKYHNGGGAYMLYVHNTGQLGFLSYDGTNAISELTSTLPNVIDGTWHHIAVTVNNLNGNMYWYVDGSLRQTKTFTPIGSWRNTQNAYIGYRAKAGTEQWFNGDIDDVRVYNYARTQQQIQQDMGEAAVGGGVDNPIPQPIAHYSLDEQQGQIANNRGTGGNALNGTLGANNTASTDDPTWKTKTDCKVNGCTSFDGSNDYVNMGDPTNLRLSSTGSVSLWAKPNNYPSSGWDVIFSKGNWGAGRNYYSMYYTQSSSNLSFAVGGASANIAIGLANTTTPLAQWTHLTLTWDGSTVKAYANGIQIGSTSQNSQVPDTSTYNFNIGTSSGSSSYGFDGSIDEVKIYNTALTADQVKQDFNAGQSVVMAASNEAANLTDGAGNPPIAEWKFDEKSNSTASDTSGNTKTGSLTATTVGQGKYGAALRFNGSSSGMTASAIPIRTAGAQTHTISVWFKTNAASTGPLMQFTGSGVEGAAGWRSGTGNLSASIYTTSHQYTDASSTYRDNNWHQLVAVLDDTSWKLYVDGGYISQNTNATTANAFTYSASPNICIGRRCSSTSGDIDDVEYFNGSIDHFKIYNYARTPAQIAYDYNRGEPIAHWKLDECTGTVANDISGNGYKVTIIPGDATGDNDTAGTCSSGTTTEMWNDGTTGKFNGSLGFDGTNDYVCVDTDQNGTCDTAANGVPSGTNFSAAAWVKRAANNANHGIVGKSDFNINGTGFRMRIDANNVVGVRIGNAATTEVVTTQTITDTNWHHVVFTYNGATIDIYIDGKLSISGAATGAVGSDTANQYTVGALEYNNAITNFFSGQIDDVRVYNYTLSATQIKTIMNNNSAIRFGPSEGSP